MPPPDRPYHHGNLPRTLIDAAIEVIDEVGPAAMSFREVARRVGVSSAAPAHHFRDKAGLFTAIAVEGYDRLAASLADAYCERDNFLDVGVAYVQFAVTNRAYFEVMFRPDLHHSDSADLTEARRAASAVLYEPASSASGRGADGSRVEGLAAWSIVHGLATLILSGNLPSDLSTDPESLARQVAGQLFRPPGH